MLFSRKQLRIALRERWLQPEEEKASLSYLAFGRATFRRSILGLLDMSFLA